MKENETRNIGTLHPVDSFICEKCGIRLEDWVQLKEDPDMISCCEYEFRFCPNCGRKIVEEE